MYRIAICDDDERYIEYLEKLFKSNFFFNENNVMFFRYTSGEALIDNLKKEIPFDLLILDMQLEQMDGDETAKMFRQKYPNTLLVFCSGVKLPSVKSFEVNAYRYLLKEYDKAQMIEALTPVISEMKRREVVPNIQATYRGDVRGIELDDVLYVSIRKHGCSIHLRKSDDNHEQTILSNKRIDEIFSEIEKYDFAYAHNSYFINLKYVKGIIKHDVTLVDGTVLPIARSKEKAFKERFVDYLGKKY